MRSSTRPRPQTLQIDGLPLIHPNAAAMDISADEVVVAVPPDRDPTPVRAFRTFTPDLADLVAWLRACRIDTVALESTGVYWLPIYELLEQGTALMQAGMQDLQDLGMREATLWVLRDNLRARRFYEQLGWMPDRRTVSADYGGRRLEALCFRQ